MDNQGTNCFNCCDCCTKLRRISSSFDLDEAGSENYSSCNQNYAQCSRLIDPSIINYDDQQQQLTCKSIQMFDIKRDKCQYEGQNDETFHHQKIRTGSRRADEGTDKKQAEEAEDFNTKRRSRRSHLSSLLAPFVTFDFNLSTKSRRRISIKPSSILILLILLCTINNMSCTTINVRVSREAAVERCPSGLPADVDQSIIDAPSKGLLAPIVFIGKLISLSEDYAGRIAATFRVIKQIKNIGSSPGTVPVNLLPGTHVTIYYVNQIFPPQPASMAWSTSYGGYAYQKPSTTYSRTMANIPPYCAVQLNKTQVDTLRPIGKYIVYASPPLTSLVKMHQQHLESMSIYQPSMRQSQVEEESIKNKKDSNNNSKNISDTEQGHKQADLLASGKDRPGTSSTPSFPSFFTPSSATQISSKTSTTTTQTPSTTTASSFFQHLFGSREGITYGNIHGRKRRQVNGQGNKEQKEVTNGTMANSDLKDGSSSSSEEKDSYEDDDDNNDNYLGHINYLSAFAPPDMFSKRSVRAMKKVLCTKCGKFYSLPLLIPFTC